MSLWIISVFKAIENEILELIVILIFSIKIIFFIILIDHKETHNEDR